MKSKKLRIVKKLFLVLLLGFQWVAGVAQKLRIPSNGKVSYYSDAFQGRRTSNGEIYNRDSMTAAHARLPFGTRIKITNLKNMKTVIVRVNDRCRVYGKRLFDVSRAAAVKLEMIRDGIANVKFELVDTANATSLDTSIVAKGADLPQQVQKPKIASVAKHPIRKKAKPKTGIAAKPGISKPIAVIPVKSPVPKPVATAIAHPAIKKPKTAAIKPIPAVRVTKPPLKPLPATPFTIQLGVYKEKTSAQKLADNLQKKGFKNTKLTPGASGYKVTLGQYNTETEAQAMIKKLKDLDVLGHVVKM